jgi:hypothetical protein
MKYRTFLRKQWPLKSSLVVVAFLRWSANYTAPLEDYSENRAVETTERTCMEYCLRSSAGFVPDSRPLLDRSRLVRFNAVLFHIEFQKDPALHTSGQMSKSRPRNNESLSEREGAAPADGLARRARY